MQFKFEVDIAQIRQEHNKLKYRKLDKRIKQLIDDYSNIRI